MQKVKGQADKSSAAGGLSLSESSLERIWELTLAACIGVVFIVAAVIIIIIVFGTRAYQTALVARLVSDHSKMWSEMYQNQNCVDLKK